MTREETIRLLHGAGHTPEKALEVAIEAERGDPVAIKWVAAITHAVNDGSWPITRTAIPSKSTP